MNACGDTCNLGDASKRTPRKSERPSTPRRADDSPDDSQLHSPQTLRRETTDLYTEIDMQIWTYQLHT